MAVLEYLEQVTGTKTKPMNTLTLGAGSAASPFVSPEYIFLAFSLSGETHNYVVVGGGFSKRADQILLLDLDNLTFSALAEAAFAEDWNSDADAAYDDL